VFVDVRGVVGLIPVVDGEAFQRSIVEAFSLGCRVGSGRVVEKRKGRRGEFLSNHCSCALTSCISWFKVFWR
jgi:hypothetical protein